METEKKGAGKFLDPKSIIAQLGIYPGSMIADLGCGSGYFSIPLAEAVGSEGMVYALDILPSALESVSSKAKVAGISNIKATRANLESENGSRLASGSLDWVILKDMLFQNKNKEIIIAEAYRILKPGASVLVVEWNNKEQEIGPDLQLRIAQRDAIGMVEKQGFKEIVPIQAGEFHYAFSAKK